MNRRDFVTLMGLAPGALQTSDAFAPAAAATSPPDGNGFPVDDYTPFGYLDNPWHSWDLHRSGILRSLPGIGFALYYPAGPGGYFSYSKNGIYESHLALQFDIDGVRFRGPGDFHEGQLTASHHSRNLLAYEFDAGGLHVTSAFILVNEDAIGVQVTLTEAAGKPRTVKILAHHTYKLGGETWWGRDGLAGGFDQDDSALWIRSFAAGTVFAVSGTHPVAAHFVAASPDEIAHWLDSPSRISAVTSYYPAPLYGGLRYDLRVGAHSRASAGIVMARGENSSAAVTHARASVVEVPAEIARKRAEDAVFWNQAPQLTGDWPAHWKRGWVYDFETLRMMVRRPIGVYKHRWDAMQIQAPRNVLAETSIDMWALSYADPETAKAVFLGQFADALEPNVPCMREDGVMNMVAADGSECGTSISWCFPFFCAESIFRRTRDSAWLKTLYPHLTALLRWTIANRSDNGGFLVGKCSWETGMDASKRFLIQQPTGGELTEFIRLVELQAAAAHAAAFLARAARLLHDDESVSRWEQLRDRFTAKTQELWHDGWFRDSDTRTAQLVTSVPPDPAQSAPAFCGVANAQQLEEMRRTLRKFYEDSRALGQPAEGWDDGLAWSSMVLPYVESIWATGDGALAANVVHTIAERIYASMDRRSVEPEAPGAGAARLGWPGVSCEIWGAHGAFGGEGYGWGAVMPAHIIRSLIGVRETDDHDRFWVCPNLPDSLMVPGRRYGITGLRYGGPEMMSLEYRVVDQTRLLITAQFSGDRRPQSVRGRAERSQPLEQRGGECRFEALNHERYTVELLPS